MLGKLVISTPPPVKVVDADAVAFAHVTFTFVLNPISYAPVIVPPSV